MPVQVKCSKQECGKVMSVGEELAGRSVSCPDCGTSVTVPGTAAAGPTFMETIDRLCQENGIDGFSRILLAGGMISLAFLALSMLILPRATVTYTIELFGKKESQTGFWIGSSAGAFLLMITMAVAGFVVASFAKMHVFLKTSLFAAAGWGALASFVLLGLMLHDSNQSSKLAQVSVGIGSQLGLLASLGITGTFGYLAYLRMKK